MTNGQAKTAADEDQPSPPEEVSIQSRVHRPLHFQVRGHGTVRVGAFERVKLPAFALHAADLQTLMAEGAIRVIAPDTGAGPDAAAEDDDKAPRGERGGRKRDDKDA